MKFRATLGTLLLIILAVYWSFETLSPPYGEGDALAASEFSTENALRHVGRISEKPHAVGFEAHSEVQEYIVGELQKLGLDTEIQSGYTAGDRANFSRAENLLARITGKGKGKALLLLSHYDSSPHSSLGASDAGSGVAAILEGLRAFAASGITPQNDIIVLISDAEEIGLNGADLFVNTHPWVEDVGLVLNFEARGSGGPSIMLIETNHGNARLIDEFANAGPPFPIANSLVYSVYKMLPNDTDLTVFREDRDIPGLNFAFIDDHYDYHTARDDFERLDRNSLAHQGSYLMPLLRHFSSIDLGGLQYAEDKVYTNVPLFKWISYPYAYIWPMFLFALVIFVILLIRGFRKGVLNARASLKGLLPMLLALAINGLAGFYAWPLLKALYPGYRDILHGFPYNGHSYIATLSFFSLGVCFLIYRKFHRAGPVHLLPSVLLLWLCICGAIAAYLPGASFFILPVIALLAIFMIMIAQKKPNPLLLIVLSLPALWIFPPFVQLFPVGLGLRLMVTATVITTLAFFLLLPLFGAFRYGKRLGVLCLLIAGGFLISAHFHSGFNLRRPKPSSLLYVLDTDAGKALWATYEHEPSGWTSRFLGKERRVPELDTLKTLSSKYGSDYTYVAEAPIKSLPTPLVETLRDTVIGDERVLHVCIMSQRRVNRREIFTNDLPITKALVNDVPLSENYLRERRGGRLLTHYISDQDDTELRLRFPESHILELYLFEASNDLLHHPEFDVPPRPADQIPMPFVLNDAVLLKKTVRFDE